MNITTLGIDIAKNVFELHGVDKNGHVIISKQLSDFARSLFDELLCELRDLDVKVKCYDSKIESICQNNVVCQRLIQVEGVGTLTATAVVTRGKNLSKKKTLWLADLKQRRAPL